MPNKHKFARRPVAQLLASALFLPSLPALAAPPVTVAGGSGQTATYTSANGVTVVNINGANGAGLSHNKYVDYNVPANGVVLNNGNLAQISRQSQLAGQVAFNPNLATEAKLILNEVVSTNRSLLRGYTEVLGGRADVVVANPNGITCSGCGFINTNRVSLVTGTPNLAPDGSLRDFSVSRGDVLINGAGLDASAQQYLDLVSRSVLIDGQINVPALRIATGNNVWNYGSALVTGATTPEGAIPAFAFDSTVLGGMYAGRIAVVATEAGVGVRMLGQAAATADDFSIDAAGKIAIGAKLSAARDLKLTSTSNASEAIALTDASLSAKNNLELTAASGGAILNGGVLVADNNLTMALGTLTDTATASALTDNNKRYAGGSMSLALSGAANLDSVNYGAAGPLAATAHSLAVGAGGAALYSASTLNLRASVGNLDLAAAAVRSVGDMVLQADSGNISFAGGAGQGVQTTSGNLNMTAAGFDNSGTLTADAGNVTLRANGTISNGGTINAGAALDIADQAGAASASVSNRGKLLGGSMNIKADALAVTGGGVLESAGSMNLALNTLNVGSAGDTSSRIVAASSGRGAATIDVAGVLSNDGILSSGDDLNIVAAALASGASSRIAALGGLRIDALTGDLLGQGAWSAGRAMNLRALSGNLVFGNVAMRSVGDMVLQADNGSIAFAGGAGQGVQTTNGNLSLTAASGFSNAGTLTADVGNVTLRSNGAVGNSGTINAGGVLDLADSGGGALDSLANTGKLRGASMNVRADSLSITGGGVVETTGNIDLTLGSLVVGGAGDTTSRIVAATSGGGTATIKLASDFTNYGAVHSGQNLSLTAPSIVNTASGGISALDTLVVDALSGNLLNQGALYAGQHLIASASGVFTNDGTLSAAMGSIDSDGDMSLSASTFVNNSAIRSAGNLSITADTFRNEVKGGDTRTWVYGTHDAINTGSSGWYDCGVDQCLKTYMRESWNDHQYYSGGVPRFSPSIVAGGGSTLSVQGFSSGTNLGGNLSGGTVNFSGNAGATFANDALAVLNKDHYFTFEYYWEDWLVGDSGIDGDVRNQSATVTTTTTLASVGASIRANTLNMGGFTLVNSGSPWAPAPFARNQAASGFAGLTLSLPGVLATGFGGLTISLPSNPNGMFVISKNPASQYLVESNPLFTSQNAIGSNYLANLLGFDPDMLMKRLGDASYEGYLIRLQLIAQTGNNLLKSYGSERAQMQSLLEHGASQSKSMGLKIGQGLSLSQQAGLEQDMVWMVETVVDGQKVLAPVVYLAASTRAMIEPGGGALIAADQANLNLTSLSNSGGTIAGKTALNVTMQGDILNTSGTIKGGDVALASTQGSIINRTLAETSGDDNERRTTIGKQADIVASGKLNVDAAKDVTSLAGKIAAGGDVSLAAGGNVTLDTVENKNASTTHSGRSDITTRATEQVRSDLSSGGNLTIKARNDITIAGSSVNAKGNAALDAGDDLNIVARDNTRQVVTKSEQEGFGVGGGLWGKEKTTTDTFQSRSVGSSINSSGDISLSAGKTATLEGAKVSSAGATSIAAQDVQVLAARDVDRTTTTTETTSFLSTSQGEGDKSSALTKAGVKSDGVVKAGANASATNDAGGVDLVKTTKTTTFDEDTRSVGSQLTSAGGLTITSKNDTTLQGAEVKAGGDVSLSGQNVNILAAQDTHVSSSSTTTTKVGLYASTTNAADAKAGAGATANAAIGAANANAGSNATANAGSSTSIDVLRIKTTETESVDITHKGTTLAAAGNLSINSAKTLTVQGSDVSGDKGVDLKAKDMAFLAAQDTHTSSTNTTATNAGLYIDGNANSSATANASANAGLGANAGAKSEAGVNAVASVGVQGRNVTSSGSEGSSTARVSTITSAAGSIKRTAGNSIGDVGTTIDAAGDFSQSAKTITSQAAENTSYSSSERTTNTAKVGVYAKAEAGVSADAGANAGLGLDGKPKAEAGANAEAKAKVGAGVKASYSRDTASSGDSSSEAVVSTIRAGGKVSSVSSDKTSLEGTQIAAGTGGVELQAASLDFSAAKSTTSSTSSTGNINASASVGVSRGTGKGVDVDVAGGTSSTGKSSETSTATAGSITTTGDLVIRTTGDTRLEGTNLAAVGDTTVAAGGKLVFDAVRDTASSSKSAYDASASVSTSDSKGAGGTTRSGVDASAAGGFSRSTAESSTATAGSINTGGKLTLSAGQTASFEGTAMAAGGDATVAAKDGVTISAARSTSASESYGARVGVSAGSSKESDASGSSSGKSGSATVEGNYSNAKSSTAQAGSLTSGGNLKIVSGQDVNLEGTNLGAGGKASVLAGGTVNFTAAQSTSSSTGVSASLSASAEKTDKTPAVAAPKSAAKNPGTGGTQGSDGSKQSNADLAKWQKNQASVVEQLKAKQSGTASSGANQGAASAAKSGVTAADAAPTTESKSSVSLGVQVQTKNSTVQKAGSISAGSGGVEVVAAGGNVNLVGTNITTAGDADISAKGEVNISATRNTSSGINVAAAASADRSSEAPTAKSATGASTAKPSATSSAASAEKKTPPAVSTAPKPERKSAGATPSTTATTASDAATSKKTPPPVPSAPKPERKTAAGSSAAPTADKAAATTPEAAKSSAAATTAVPEKDPNKFGGSVAGATNTDENKSSTFVGVGGGGSVKNQGATIKTGGKVNIKSGGKTLLTNTAINAEGGQSIDAKGGVERKTEKDTSMLNASTDSGPAGANQVLSKVPTATANPATGAPGAPGTPGMAVNDAAQGANAAPQSALNAAQGKNSTPAIKKN